MFVRYHKENKNDVNFRVEQEASRAEDQRNEIDAKRIALNKTNSFRRQIIAVPWLTCMYQHHFNSTIFFVIDIAVV
jgi:hypothetical protein